VKIALRAAVSPGHPTSAAAQAIVTSLPAKGVLVDALGGVVTAAPYTLPTPEVTYTPATHGCGVPYTSFTVAAGDGAAASAASEVIVSVVGAPDAPSVDFSPPAATTAPQPYVYTLVARDGDILGECASAEVRVRIASLPEIGALHQVGSDGVTLGALIATSGTALTHATTHLTAGTVTAKVAYVPVDDNSPIGYGPGVAARGPTYKATFTYFATDGDGGDAQVSAAEMATITVSHAPTTAGEQLTAPILLASSVDGEQALGVGGGYNVAGHAAMFDGLDDALVAVFPSEVAGSFMSFTVEAWFKATSAAHGGATLVLLPGTAALHLQHFGGLALQVRSTLGRTLQAATPALPNDGAWHHVAAEYDASAERARVYLDGALAGEMAHTPLQRSDLFGAVRGPTLMYVGGDGSSKSSHCFRGQVDEARVWSSARAESRAALRTNTAAGTEPGLVAYFRFDIQPGSDPASTAVIDFGPYNLSAAFVNAGGRASVVASTAPVVRHPTRTRVGRSVQVRLHVADADRSSLTYHVTGLPDFGELYALPGRNRITQLPYLLLGSLGDGSGTPAVEYTPTSALATGDTFEFSVTEPSPGRRHHTGVIAIVVDPINTVPRPQPVQPVNVAVDTFTPLRVSATFGEGGALRFFVSTLPGVGTLHQTSDGVTPGAVVVAPREEISFVAGSTATLVYASTGVVLVNTA